MRRPLALFMVSCLAGMLIIVETRWGIGLAMGIFVLTILYVGDLTGSLIVPARLELCGISIGMAMAFFITVASMTPAVEEGTWEVYGYAYGPDYGNTGKLVLEIDKVETEGELRDANAKILIISDRDLSAFRHRFVRYRGVLSDENPPSNPKGFDFERYALIKGYDKVSFHDGQGYIESAGGPKALDMVSIKDGILDKSKRLLDKNSQAYFASLVFGDTSLLGEEQTARIGMSGLSHLFAVSGLHIAILYAFIVKMTNMLFRRKRLLQQVVAIASVFAFISAIGFPVSAIRAFVFISVLAVSRVARRKYDLLNALLLAAFIILAWNPYQAFSAGFQLSFAAVASIHFIYPALERFGKSDSTAMKAFLVSLAVQIGVAPIVIWHFNYISIVSIVANVPAVIFFTLWLPFLYIFAFVTGFSIPAIPEAAVPLVHAGTAALDAFSKFTTSLPMASFELPSMDAKCMALYYAICILFVLQSKKDLMLKPDRLKKAALIAVAVILVAMIPSVAGSDDEIEIIFFDVGQGDCVLVRTPSGMAVLVDGGKAEKDMKDLLLRNGIGRIDLAVLSHFHEDHYGGLLELVRSDRVESLLTKDTAYENADVKSEIEESMELSGKRVFHPKDRQTFAIDGIKIEAVNVGSDYSGEALHSAENNDSLAVFLTYGNFEMLLAGDIEEEAEKKLVSGFVRDSDILKASHHGSASSNTEAFLKACDPEVVVVQVGRNLFGHPAQSVLERCESVGADIYRTDKDGAVSIVTDGSRGFTIETCLSDRRMKYDFE